MSRDREATVLGFGGRAPAPVLRVLSLALCREIRPERSQALPLALLQAPYRTFLKQQASAVPPQEEDGRVADTKEEPRPLPLLIYCLPSSVAECVHFASETSRVRAALFEGQSVVAVYDPTSDSFVGGDEDAVLAALESPLQRRILAKAALRALAQLDDGFIAQQLWSDDANNDDGTAAGDVVIVVGSGGREHALAVALAQSPLVGQVLCCPGNGGTAAESNRKIKNQGANQDNATVLELVQQTNARMVVVGPEAPLVDGLVDELAQKFPQVRAFGPTRAGAQLEASKAFTKDFLQEHGIPTAKYRNFTDVNEALAYVESLDETDLQVVKASGLAAGKGVLLPTSKAEALQAVKEIMSDKAFGSAGDTCVIESFLTGPEASCLAFCDGKTAKLMPAAQDHKRALDNDQGLNTGGMGAYAPAPCVTPALQQEIEAMCVKTVQKMAEGGTPYVGILYAGMMLTPNGPYVLEFNCRFGDPETQVVLPLLETDLYEIMTACCTGSLDSVDVRFKEGISAATVVCAAKGYPEAYPKGMEITGISDADMIPNVKVYHAGTTVDGSLTRCSGGRVLAVTGTGPSLQAALRNAYQGVSTLDFVDPSGSAISQMHYRSDIGRRAISKKLRIGVMGSTRGTALLPVIEACSEGSIPAEVVAVLSNKATAPILEKGRALGPTVLTKFVSSKGLTRTQFDAECTAALLSASVDYILLVGYMRILSKEFCEFWKGRCINVHPSLLPKHAGGMDLEVHQAVLIAKECETGCTIHEVTETVDGGPIVVQKKVTVDPGDTAESLKAKVQALEGPAFIEAIQTFCRGTAISYADAGVSIDSGNKLVDLIKPFCKATRRAGCDADLGGFGGLFDLAAAGFVGSDTVLIGATDGVGTKLRIAQETKNHDTVGIDLVAMCVNDLIVAGGEPLFFLDYFATGKLEVEQAASVVKGIAEGCKQAGCGLIGGETAEMPSMYPPGEYDLAGFSVGAVHRDAILPRGVSEGDVLLGLSSSGIHSNGYSLVRRLIEHEGLSYASSCPWDTNFETVGDSLLIPTKIYVKSCLPLIKEGLVNGMAHITGGGLLENLPRSLPDHLDAEITGHPPLPPVFRWMKETSGLSDAEMLRTFNCGIGMVVILAPDKEARALELLEKMGETDACRLGRLVAGSRQVRCLEPLK